MAQAAEGDNIAVLKRDGDHVSIENDPVIVRGWRIDQIAANLMELPVRSFYVETLINERRDILDKKSDFRKNKKRLAELDELISKLPTVDNPEDQAAMELIREAASLIKKRELKMIRINRPAKVPAILSGRGQQETARHRAKYDKDPATYQSGSAKFNKSIYGAPSVRNKLKACQHNKCCYSEGKFVGEPVHVEHFRPKGAIGEEGTKNKLYPGYYWLAYEWSNLLTCKAVANSLKGDYFPLFDENTRRRNHHDNNEDVGQEQPMLVDPASEDPRDHIRFHNEEPYGITDRGKYTVKLLLRHPSFDEDRRERFQDLKLLKDTLEALEAKGVTDGVVGRIKARLNDAVQSTAIFSSMAIDLLAGENTV